ncbi:MAG: hypothetical protein IJX72_04480 [Clostridia bacterium]|nr:hypothetical protein [Clostridia bacterium]
MKKLIATIVCVIVLAALCTVCAAAATQEVGCWIENAKNAEEILAGEAGEREIGWEVPFLHITPEINGTIDRNEYQPFELYEDYLSWMAPVGTENDGTTEEEFQEFYDSTQIDFFDAWWGWDGTYLYIAFEINCINGYKCDPEQDVLLFAENCLQVGIADVDAVGKDPSYVELGCGVHSETGDQITFNWSGNYCPKAGEDFVGSYDAENQVLVYEMRIHLQSALGLDRLVENGDEMNYAWLLSVNGQAQTTNENWQLGFCHGIGGPYSGKVNEYFARVSFTGKPDDLDLKPIEIPGMSQEDIDYKLMEYIDFSDEAVINTFEAENAAVEYVTEGEESFMRITSLAIDDQVPHVFSSKYPKNVLGGQADYVVVKYRTSYEKGEDLGLIFRTVNTPEYNLDECYYEIIGNDGEWHTVIFYMKDDPTWSHFIMNIGFVPFVFSENTAQQTIDIAWMKVYQNDPYDLYYDSEYDPNAGKDEETTVAVGCTEATTVADTQAPDAAVTTAPADEGATTTSSATTEPAETGCASVVGMGAVAVLAVAAAFVALKKKED